MRILQLSCRRIYLLPMISLIEGTANPDKSDWFSMELILLETFFTKRMPLGRSIKLNEIECILKTSQKLHNGKNIQSGHFGLRKTF